MQDNTAALSMKAEQLPAALAAAEKERFAAMMTSDVDSLTALLSEKLVYIHSSGAIDTKDSYLTALASGVLTYLSIDYSVTHALMLSEDSCMAVGMLKATADVSGRQLLVDTAFSAGWSLTDRWCLTFWYSGHRGPA